ncbi:hypothetical protein M878_38045 [Streptomyces roseochromogenus subsp. oscitans DS 12.976]|uniref:Uncharacterized protein n=1 Tax=Streptomyces roseochromogenus subsp. oscitans DS 12.976 TaxID=1352936 RepID=V6JN02_STRRC|nr:hypothetical protein M878_38045 [Streptomyces roseochromogenus subsp. oscitans DS 12.976]
MRGQPVMRALTAYDHQTLGIDHLRGGRLRLPLPVCLLAAALRARV